MRRVAEIEVVLADDQPLSLLGMRSAVADQSDIRILAECEDANCLVGAIRHHPDVVLVNTNLLHDQLGTLRQLVAQNRKTQVIVITSQRDRKFLEEVVRCGAKGVIQSECSLEEIPTAIRKVRSGGVWREREAA